MSRRHLSSPGFGERVEVVRTRLGLTKRDFASLCGIQPGSYKAWVDRDSAPGAFVLAKGCRALRVADWAGLLAWLSIGDEAPRPRWLDDPTADPRAQESQRGPRIAEPSRALDLARENASRASRYIRAGERAATPQERSAFIEDALHELEELDAKVCAFRKGSEPGDTRSVVSRGARMGHARPLVRPDHSPASITTRDAA